jgi:excisionase family DNA binding protein
MKKRAFTKQDNHPISVSDLWFNSKEASDYLGISVRTLFNEVSKGNIPYYKFGKRNRYLKSELDQMLLENYRGPIWR